MHYYAASTDSGCLLVCDHEHQTVISAAACMSCAAGYVVAVENGRLRALNEAEEAEFQHALYGGMVERVFKGIAGILPAKWSLS